MRFEPLTISSEQDPSKELPPTSLFTIKYVFELDFEFCLTVLWVKKQQIRILKCRNWPGQVKYGSVLYTISHENLVTYLLNALTQLDNDSSEFN